jgi:hypothetical protein
MPILLHRGRCLFHRRKGKEGVERGVGGAIEEVLIGIKIMLAG